MLLLLTAKTPHVKVGEVRNILNLMGEKVLWPFPKEPFPLWWRYSSSFALLACSVISKIGLCYLNKTKIYNAGVVQDLVTKRPPNTPLITVTNHHSCIDDPILAGMLSWKTMFQPRYIRWTPGANDICFTKARHRVFFGLTQLIPVIRGGGIFQRGMDYTIEKLNQSKWVHLFPEGRVNMDKTFIRLKWGVGRLIHECKYKPVVLPIYHLGLDDVLPNFPPYVPQIGKKVTILIGDPIDLEVHRKRLMENEIDAQQFRKDVTDEIQNELELLKLRTIELHNAR